MDKQDRLAWMDLVVTKLPGDDACAIELAFAVTDGQLELIAEGPSVLVREPLSLLEPLEDFRHARSDDARTEHLVDMPASSMMEAQASMLAFLSDHCPEGSPPLAGDDVARDRRFLRRFMAELDAFLHYRIIDVSTVEELVRRWYPETHAAQPARDPGHRAMDGIREAMRELRYYRQTIFG